MMLLNTAVHSTLLNLWVNQIRLFLLPSSTLFPFQFLLTIMCAATRFPEAIPLHIITVKVVTKALIKFFSTFGLPRVIQTDQGTNFKSRIFVHFLNTLGIENRVFSAYHPQSQGALERFHQTLKSMIRKHCLDWKTDWDESVPLVLFAVQETVQESLGFSPASLVFEHTVRGPLQEQFVSAERKPQSVPKYVLNSGKN